MKKIFIMMICLSVLAIPATALALKVKESLSPVGTWITERSMFIFDSKNWVEIRNEKMIVFVKRAGVWSKDGKVLDMRTDYEWIWKKKKFKDLTEEPDLHKRHKFLQFLEKDNGKSTVFIRGRTRADIYYSPDAMMREYSKGETFWEGNEGQKNSIRTKFYVQHTGSPSPFENNKKLKFPKGYERFKTLFLKDTKPYLFKIGYQKTQTIESMEITILTLRDAFIKRKDRLTYYSFGMNSNHDEIWGYYDGKADHECSFYWSFK